MPRIIPAVVPEKSGASYPAPHDIPCKDRVWRQLGDAVGLTQFGVNLVYLAPGVWSSQRHWHTEEDEFVYVLDGAVVLVDDDGEHELRPGDCAGFPAGDRNGHCFQNRSDDRVTLLAVGSRRDGDRGEYADIDMQFLPNRDSGGGLVFAKKDGTGF